MKEHVHKAARATEFCACGATRVDGGEWEAGKDPNAVALGGKAAAMATPEARRKRASAGGVAKWRGVDSKRRSAIMREISSRPRPSRRNEDRCECGRFSRSYAEKHKHICGKAFEGIAADKAAKAAKSKKQKPSRGFSEFDYKT